MWEKAIAEHESDYRTNLHGGHTRMKVTCNLDIPKIEDEKKRQKSEILNDVLQVTAHIYTDQLCNY